MEGLIKEHLYTVFRSSRSYLGMGVILLRKRSSYTFQIFCIMIKEIDEYDTELWMQHHVINDVFVLKMKKGGMAVKLCSVFDQGLQGGENILMGVF